MSLISWLYAPVTNTKLIPKAMDVGADVVIFDLEDSVPTEQKQYARQCLLQQLHAQPAIKTCVRINPTHSEAGIQDIIFMRENRVVPDYIVIPKPKVEHDAHLVYTFLGSINPHVKIYPLVETVSSLSELRAMSSAPTYMGGVFFGSADFAADMCISPLITEFSWVRHDIALHARRLKIQAIDTPCFNMCDDEVNLRHVEQALTFGFTGKQAIHPRQIEGIREAFGADIMALRTMVERINEANINGDTTVQRFDDHVYGPPLVRYFDNLIRQLNAA